MEGADIRTGIPGAGSAGADIYTRLVLGAAPPPPVSSFLLKEDGFFLLQENGDKIILG
jgi:hypothetical protein